MTTPNTEQRNDAVREALAKAEAAMSEMFRYFDGGEPVDNWQPIDTAPRDGTPFIAALWVKHTNGRSWQETHIVWCDDETGEIDSACDQGWSRVDDYVAWMSVPDLPPIKEPR